MVRGSLAALVAVCGLAPAAGAKVKIEAMKHDIQQITMSNFDGVISKFRDSAVSSLWFFKDDNKADVALLSEYNQVAKDLKGMAKVCAISCTEWPVFCEKQGVTETPAIMVFPTNPMPAFKYDGKMEAKAITGKVSRFIPDFSTKLTKDTFDQWAGSEITKPKVMVFSNKKTPPTMLKALSSETVFKRTVKFGFVTEEEQDLVQKYKIKTFPAVVMQRGAKGETKEQYKGEMSFSALKDWINLHSESGMGDKLAGPGGKEKEETVVEEVDMSPVPEMTFKNNKALCFKGDGLCVIYLKEGKISKEETDMLEGLSNKFTSQLSDRGAKLKWMWMDLAVEAEYKELFQPTQLPSVVVFNPHKRLRFTSLEHGEDNEIKSSVASITGLLDKVLGGDARFKMVPGQKLPNFVARQPAVAGKKSEL